VVVVSLCYECLWDILTVINKIKHHKI
jgi:hypothetical protein